MKRYDVIVIGGGPAGSFISKLLAGEGFSVLLVEKKRYPGENIHCAEGLSSASIEGILRIKDRWVSVELKGAEINSPSKGFTVLYPGVGWILDRRMFDRDLFLEAVQSGAECLTGVAATSIEEYSDGERVVRTTAGSFRSPLVVGADGVSGFVGRETGLLKPFNLKEFHQTYQCLAYTGIDDQIAHFYVGRSIAPGGYAWVFPKGGGFSNVGIGIDRSLTRRSAKVYFEQFVKNYINSFRPVSCFGSAVPTTVNRRLVGEGVALVGDGGRLTDPLSGGGIAHALISSYMLYTKIKEHGICDRALKAYEKEWNRSYGRNNNWGWRAKMILRELDDDTIERIVEFGIKNYHRKVIDEIKVYDIIKSLIREYPDLMKLGLRLLRGRYDL